MKKTFLFLIALSMCAAPALAEEYLVRGPQGGLSMIETLPDGFNKETGRCPMVILMHGIFSSKDFTPMPAIARALAAQGIGSLRFDFNGHGRSEGLMQEITVEKEIADARAVWEYACSLPYAGAIGFLGHSQGGVIASMTAGLLAAEGVRTPDAMVLIAPASVIKDACRKGKFFDATFDPSDPPEFVRCWGMMKLGRDYLLTTQVIDIYGTAAAYKGPCRLIHGSKDTIVPLWCSEEFVKLYGEDRASLVVVEGADHTITMKKREVVANVVSFFKETIGRLRYI